MISTDHELAGVAPYSFVHRLRDSYGSVALLQTTLANEEEERVFRIGLIGASTPSLITLEVASFFATRSSR